MFYVSITLLHQCSPPAFSETLRPHSFESTGLFTVTSSEQKMSASNYFFDYIPRLENSILTCCLKCMHVYIFA